jgi:hypothetical protein
LALKPGLRRTSTIEKKREQRLKSKIDDNGNFLLRDSATEYEHVDEMEPDSLESKVSGRTSIKIEVSGPAYHNLFQAAIVHFVPMLIALK